MNDLLNQMKKMLLLFLFAISVTIC